jgi:hypothetical protein
VIRKVDLEYVMSVLDEEFYKGHARKIRNLAEDADPFIRKRLLQLAARYEKQPVISEPSRASANLQDLEVKMTAER